MRHPHPHQDLTEFPIYKSDFPFILRYSRDELELFDQEVGFSRADSGNVAPKKIRSIYHGSPLSPNALKTVFKNAGDFESDFIALRPSQPYRINPETRIKEPYGKPGVCAGELKEAVGRSFLHGLNPAIKELKPEVIVSGIPDSEFTSFAFTPLSVVRALAKSNARGYVYALDLDNSGFEKSEFDTPEDTANDLNEHRSQGLVVPMAAFELELREINHEIIAVEGGLKTISDIRRSVQHEKPVGLQQMLELARQHTNSMLIHEAI